MDILTELFVCLDCGVSMFGASGQSYLHATQDSSTTTMPHIVPQSFASLEEASWHLNLLSNAVTHAREKLFPLAETECTAEFGATMGENQLREVILVRSRTVDLHAHPDLLAELQHLEGNIQSWLTATMAMPKSERQAGILAHTTLQIRCFCGRYHRSAERELEYTLTYDLRTWVFTAYCRDSTESASDRHVEIFAHYLDLVRESMHTGTTADGPDPRHKHSKEPSRRDPGCLKGAMVLLFLTATKCRDSALRWTAVSLLHQLKLQEPAFHSDVFCVYTHRAVELEEAKARELMRIPDGYPLTCENIPEHARFLDVTLELDEAHAGAGIMHCARSTGDLGGGFGYERHSFEVSEVKARRGN